MNIEDRLKNTIERKFGNVKTFAEKIDLPYTTVRSILQRGVMNAKVENVIKIADGLNMRAEDLMSLDNTQSISTIYNQLDQKRQAKVYNFADRQLREQKYGVADAGKIVPLKRREPKTVDIYGRLSAGGGAYNDKAVIETVEVDSAPPKYDMAFVVSGDSMEPMFEDGEVVFVNETQDVFNGQIAAIEINNEAFIKKIYLEDKRMRLVSLNTDIKADGSRLYPDFYADECDNLFVIGRVIM